MLERFYETFINFVITLDNFYTLYDCIFCHDQKTNVNEHKYQMISVKIKAAASSRSQHFENVLIEVKRSKHLGAIFHQF